MASEKEKAPLPFRYTFMAGERFPRQSRTAPRRRRQLTVAAQQVPSPVYLKHVDQPPQCASIDMLTPRRAQILVM
jgi:hypothetical protein